MPSVHMSFRYQDYTIEFTRKAPFLYQDLSVPNDSFPVYVCIREGRYLVSVYAKVFPNKFTKKHYENFVKKFMRDSSYREEYLQEGYSPWSEQNITEDVLCTPSLQEIELLNSEEHVSFQQLAKLRWFGDDKYKGLSSEQLTDLVSQEDLLYVRTHCPEKKVLSALTWIVRGLRREHALSRIKVELEIEENKRKSVKE